MNQSARSKLAFDLRASETTTGEGLRLAVPYLELVLRNDGDHPVSVPANGLAMLLSLRLMLEREGQREVRGAGVGDPAPLRLRSLGPRDTVTARISPLGDGPRDRPLAPGTYRAQLCVIPQSELAAPSEFAREFGGLCSNTIDLQVTALPG